MPQSPYAPKNHDTGDVNLNKGSMLRDHVLHLIRMERTRQISMYGNNEDLKLGFGGSVFSYPWLSPYTEDPATVVQESFRSDYEEYESKNGNPTWMHLIREEVAELFETRTIEDTVTEAVQVAALCVSLVEHLFSAHEGERQ